MRFSAVLFLLVFGFVSKSQAQTDTIEVGEPVHIAQIVIKLPFGKRVIFGDVAVELTNVVDSRCPKNVTCVWAGEVVVEAVIYKNGKAIETRNLNLNSPAKTLFNSENQELMGYSVLPYPDVNKPKIKQEDYVLNVVWNQF